MTWFKSKPRETEEARAAAKSLKVDFDAAYARVQEIGKVVRLADYEYERNPKKDTPVSEIVDAVEQLHRVRARIKKFRKPYVVEGWNGFGGFRIWVDGLSREFQELLLNLEGGR